MSAVAELLPDCAAWDHRPTAEQLAALPAAPAVYLLVDAGQTPIQLATTQDLRRGVTTRLSEPAAEPTRRADLAEIARGVRWRLLGSAFEGRWWYWRAARRLYPREYRKLIAFGPAAFLHFDNHAATPEIRISERVWNEPGVFVGPFPSRQAGHAALETLWDLFDLCRYPEQVRRAPRGQRCAYAEMGRCDAPCDGSAPLADYAARVAAAWRFACDGPAAWIGAATERMRAAAAAQHFERAALLKQQVAAARHWQQHWAGRIRPAEQLRCVLAVPVARRKAWRLMLFRCGELREGPLVPERKLMPEAQRWLTDALQMPLDPTLTGDERMEQTWLLAHLLNGRDAERTAVCWLVDEDAPAELGARLAERAAEIRSRGADESETPAAPP